MQDSFLIRYVRVRFFSTPYSNFERTIPYCHRCLRLSAEQKNQTEKPKLKTEKTRKEKKTAHLRKPYFIL